MRSASYRVAPTVSVSTKATSLGRHGTDLKQETTLRFPKPKRTFRNKKIIRRVLSKAPSFDSTSTAKTTTLESTAVESQNVASLATLSDDLQMQIFSFCDVSTLRSVMQLHRGTRRLLTTSAASKNLWREQCQRQWPWLPQQVHLVSSSDGWSSTSSSNTTGATTTTTPVNVPWLLSLAAPRQSTAMDESIYPPCRWNPYLRRFLPTPGWNRSQGGELCAIRVAANDLPAVQYRGPLGVGDRCIRADQPLPRPALMVVGDGRSRSRRHKSLTQRLPLSLLLQRLVRPRHRQEQRVRPFVAPMMVVVAGSNEDENANAIDLTPRLISYFEVSILPPEEEENEDSNTNSNSNSNETAGTTPRRETVGIGLATANFELHSSMPGWCQHSFGLHGDDGGLYHASGAMLEKMQTFGAGDTVGCGIDYLTQSMFFTKNGVFLGHAFAKSLPPLLHDTELYPVVGIDTHCPVQCNFGTDHRPFVFDLPGMMQGQRAAVQRALLLVKDEKKLRKQR